MIPQRLTAGDTWQWDAEYSEYPAPTWSATAYFENATAAFEILSTASGTAHSFAESAANSADIGAGRYFGSIRVTDGSSVLVVESGWMDVLPDPADQTLTDHRSWARRTLDAVEAFLEGNATTAQQSMTIAGRTLSRWSLAELNQWRDRLRAEVRTEEQAQRAGLGRDIKVRYGRG